MTKQDKNFDATIATARARCEVSSLDNSASWSRNKHVMAYHIIHLPDIFVIC